MKANRNTQTPAAATALTVIYKPAARLARITAAINRKPRSTDTRRAAYVITPNGEPQFITNTTSFDPIAAYGTTVSALYEDAARRTSGTLLLLGKSGNPIPLNMLKDIPADMMLFKGEIWEAADAARAEHATRRKDVKKYTRIINRINTTDEEREAAETERDMHRAEAAAALAYATDTESRATAHTSSDTADLIQDCALEMVLHSRMNKAPAAVVRADVRKQRSGNAYQQPHTDIIRRATCEDKAQFTTFVDSEGRTIFEPMPYIGRKGSTDGYLCIEWRDAAKDREAGNYLIHRRTTAAEYVSFTTLTEDGHEIADNNHGLNFIFDQYDRDEINRTCDRANLSATERKAVFYVFDNITARNVLKAADESGEQTESLINRLWREALRRAGVLTAAKQDSTRADILKALDPDGKLTDAEKQRKSRLMKKLNKARAELAAEEEAAAAAHHADMLKFALDGINQSREGLTIAADTRAALDVLHWVEDYPQPEALTAEEVAAREAAEAEAAAKSRRAYAADNLILAYRRAMRDHKPRRPAYAAHDALTAALVFFDSFSRAERLEVVAAATAAKAAKARAAYRAAYAEALQKRTEAAAAETAFWTKAADHDEKRSQSQSSRAAELTAAATAAAKTAAVARVSAAHAARVAEAMKNTAAATAARTTAAAAKDAATRAQRTADSLTAQATAAATAAKDLQSESQSARAAAADTTSRARAAAARDVSDLRRTAAKLTAYARLTAAEAVAE